MQCHETICHDHCMPHYPVLVSSPARDNAPTPITHASTSHTEKFMYDEVSGSFRHHRSAKPAGEIQLSANAAYRPTMGKESVKTAIYDDYEN